MAVIWVSFRISKNTVGGETYDDRLGALDSVIQTAGARLWEETTSFYAVETSASVGDLAIALKAAVAPSVDIVLVRAMDTKDARIIGANTDPDIFTFMPYLKKV